MAKFTDIALLGEGRQLKEYIEGKYTIEEIAKKFNLSLDSALRYFKDGQIKNDKFKLQMEELFQDKFENMIQTPIADQINEIILSIKANIIHYNDKEDSKVINKVYKYAKLYSDLSHQLIAQGNLAIYRYNIGLEYESTEILKEVIKTSIRNDLNDIAVYLTTQLSFNYLHKDTNNCIKILDNVKHLVNEKLSYHTLFNYYYFYGVVLGVRKKTKEARTYLEKSCQYAIHVDQKARAYLNIALTFYNDRSYKRALEWNNRAYDLSSSKDNQISILNNIANIYIKKNQLDRARWFAERAMDLFDDSVDVNRKICVYDTYIDINSANGLLFLDGIMRLLERSNDLTDNQHYLVECIKKMIQQLKVNEDIDTIKKLCRKLYEYCEEKGEKRALVEIKGVTLDTIIFLNKKGGGGIEKIC